MSFLGDVLVWLADPARWSGSDSIPTRVLEHLALSGTALAFALLVALPVGLLLGHTGRGAFFVVNVANIGRALPSLAVLALVLPLAFALNLGLGFWPTVLAMIPLAIPLILINCYAAIRAVDRELIEVAHGLGMHEWEILRDVELPIAAPIIIAGIRNAAVTVVATATLGALVASGGLGRYIVDGLARQQYERLFVGAVLVALVAIFTELFFGRVERMVVSEGVRTGGRPTAAVVTSSAR